MKSITAIVVTVITISISYSQTPDFILADPQPNLVEVWAGTFASGDIDGDCDNDLFMIGQTPAIRTKLYLNDGTGNFTEMAHPFPLSSSGQAILKDLDNDGDLDLFFAGQNQSQVVFTNIYRNDGLGGFTQVTNTALPKFFDSIGAAIADVDNDGDQDILISASTTTGFVADVYLNNGNAVFTAKGSSAFTAAKGAVAFIDMEKDGDQDVIISGKDASNVSSTKLYQNDGLGNFTLNTNSTLPSIAGFDIDVADTDNDGDYDFLINGNNQNLLYINNGSGTFTQFLTMLQQTSFGKNAFADLDNDTDQDLLIVGTQVGGLPNIYNILYQNTGNNIFVPIDTLGGEYIADCIIDDFNGDNSKDIIIQGFADKTNVYWNTAKFLSAKTDILSFSLTEQTGAAIINKTNHTIIVEVANGTDLTVLEPTITLSPGANITPMDQFPTNYTSPVTYTVTAEDGITTQTWIATVTIENVTLDLADTTIEVEVYPNPVDDILTIEIKPLNNKPICISITNLLGQELERVEVTGYQVAMLNVQKYSSGTYVLQILEGSEKRTLRFIKK